MTGEAGRARSVDQSTVLERVTKLDGRVGQSTGVCLGPQRM